ncbi:uncharacterized protein LOC130672086 [Microplitis mediator]|uniref:uncharacterized protein LOC130672086 n=1 Tax=Microplitis mediator TaxID=375433 RepID=UPI00255659C2|nr:uncharacterized protein LOC130672086 [Microplitis mediator]
MDKQYLNRKCCVVGCTSNYQNLDDMKYYCFPGRSWEKERKFTWIANVRENINQDDSWMPTKNSRICNLHFVGGERSNDPRKEGYNPTVFPSRKVRAVHSTSEDSSLPLPKKRKITENSSEQANEIEFEIEYLSNSSNDEVSEISFPHDPLENVASTQIPVEKKQTCEQSTQTSDDSPASDHDYSLSNDKNDASFLTLEDMKDNGAMKQFGGVTSSFFQVLLNDIKANNSNGKFIKKVLSENRLLLFLMRIKLGLNFRALGRIFKIANRTTSRIFHSILETLLPRAKKFVDWPNEERMKLTMSPVFNLRLNCRVVIDFLEYRLYTTPSIEQRALRHSSYEDYSVVKFLVGIGTNGQIIFLSHSYDVQASNSYIVEDCGLLNFLKAGDEVITLKELPGIQPTEDLKKIKFTFIALDRNCSADGSKKIDSYTELILIFIDRILTKIKQYHIMDHLDTKSFSDVDQIMLIVCLLVNKIE